MVLHMSEPLSAVTLREVVGDPEELRGLQAVMESDEGFALRVTGHPPGPADAQSTLLFVPEGMAPDDKVVFGVWVHGELVGVLDLLLRHPDQEGEIRPWRYDKLRSEAILMDKPIADRRRHPPR